MKKLNVLVTGGAGFIGSNIVDAYIEAGCKVWIIDNLSTGNLQNVNKNAEFIEMDVRDEKNLQKIFEKIKFDVINHQAAQIDVRKSVEDPIFDANVNILGAINLYENCRKFGVKKIIFASSGGAIYGECATPKLETDDKEPLSPYGITKFTNEFYIKFYSQIYGINYNILRYGNVYGPRQSPKGEAGVISIFSTKMLANLDVNIFGTGEQERDYVFVGDVVKANLACLEYEENDIFNIGSGIKTSVNKLFENLAKIYDYKKKAVYLAARDGELDSSWLNVEKMKRNFKIEPVKLEKGLSMTAEFYKK